MEKVDKFLRVRLANGFYLYEKQRDLPIFRLVKEAVHADPKDLSGKSIPPGLYAAEAIIQNLYGTYIRIKYKGFVYDIEPFNFEYHLEDRSEYFKSLFS